VFIKGILIGLKALTDCGGQLCLNSIEQDALLCKKAQKNDRNSITSDVMNRIMPTFSPIITFWLCSPILFLSR
jgi:hypothetical protein